MDIIEAELITCRRCGQVKNPHKNNRHLCVECVKAENNRVSYWRSHNYDWMAVAKEAELEVWERQPGETDMEWKVWLTYRDSYPGTKPSYRKVAEDLVTTTCSVGKVGARWDFPARLQGWAKYVDTLTMQQRQQEILDMNKKHISMATELNKKLEKAIGYIDPETLKPSDLKSLMAMATELERKARLDVVSVEQNLSESRGGQARNPNVKDHATKKEELQEVIDILSKAGVLGSMTGVRQVTTTTTEVLTGGEQNDL